MWSPATFQLIDAARDEDLGAGDITAALLRQRDAEVAARVVARQSGVISGLSLAPAICASFAQRLDTPLVCAEFGESAAAPIADGQTVAPGTAVAELRGPHAAVLNVERTLLNFLGRMSGVATLTRAYVDAARARNPAVQVLDTRKTIPGWRELDKYAVRCGGGHNHRFGLHDAILIKDNHLAGIPVEALASALREWLGREQTIAQQPDFIEVEVDTLDQLRAVLEVDRVSIVLLDNFAIDDLRAAVALRDQAGVQVALEASGGVTLDTIGEIAATGVDRISVGALTHSAPSLDLGLDMSG